MFSETPGAVGDDDDGDPLGAGFGTLVTRGGGGGGKGAKRHGVGPATKAADEGKGGPRLLGDMAQKDQRWNQLNSERPIHQNRNPIGPYAKFVQTP